MSFRALVRSARSCPWALALAVLSLSATDAWSDPPDYERDVRPLLDRYCFRCHGGKKTEGELNLVAIKSSADAAASPIWEQVLGRFIAVEMPPANNPQPSDPEHDTIRHWLEGALFSRAGDCQKLATDRTQNFYRGYVMSRRLTRAEYDNSIRDLTGLDLKPGAKLPNDGSGGEGFDTNGDTLFTSPILLEKYLEAADYVVEKLVVDTLSGDAPDAPPHVQAARQKVIVARPSPELPAREAAKRTIEPFVRRAFRRPVEATEVERLLVLFDRAVARGDSFDRALQLPLKAVLVSPHFLFLAEPEPEKEGVYELSGYPLAARLSYFLWASLPDDELLDVAASGRLTDSQVLAAQTRRMLQDPKARGLAENFGRQWLGIEPLGTSVVPDAQRFPEFDAELLAAMRAEAALLVDHVLRNDRPLVELLDADYTFVNQRLARHYGIAAVEGDQMRRVTLADRNRGGVLTLGAVLTTTSYPLRTSPVLRGKWLLEQVLGSKVPPPPPNVPELAKDEPGAGQPSLRERLEQHRVDPACAGCHQRMDPLGFGMENFDVLGRWRERYATAEGQGSPSEGPAVDASGVLPSGEQFRGPAELKAAVLKRQGEFVRHFVRQMLGYALGRQLNQFDQCVVDRAVEALAQNNQRSTVLVEQVVLSYPFGHRYCKK
jgi:hypothetical protein